MTLSFEQLKILQKTDLTTLSDDELKMICDKLVVRLYTIKDHRIELHSYNQASELIQRIKNILDSVGETDCELEYENADGSLYYAHKTDKLKPALLKEVQTMIDLRLRQEEEHIKISSIREKEEENLYERLKKKYG